jgi:hypothetical protein
LGESEGAGGVEKVSIDDFKPDIDLNLRQLHCLLYEDNSYEK